MTREVKSHSSRSFTFSLFFTHSHLTEKKKYFLRQNNVCDHFSKISQNYSHSVTPYVWSSRELNTEWDAFWWFFFCSFHISRVIFHPIIFSYNIVNMMNFNEFLVYWKYFLFILLMKHVRTVVAAHKICHLEIIPFF